MEIKIELNWIDTATKTHGIWDVVVYFFKYVNETTRNSSVLNPQVSSDVLYNIW